MCFPFSPGKRETHKQFDPYPFPGQSREFVYVYWFFLPPDSGTSSTSLKVQDLLGTSLILGLEVRGRLIFTTTGDDVCGRSTGKNPVLVIISKKMPESSQKSLTVLVLNVGDVSAFSAVLVVFTAPSTSS